MMQKKANPHWLPRLRDESDLISAQERLSYKLLKREEMIGKKSRVESVLVQQYVSKYGSKASSSKINAFIRASVQRLLQEAENDIITDDSLEALEMDIKEYSERIKDEILTQTLPISTSKNAKNQENSSGHNPDMTKKRSDSIRRVKSAKKVDFKSTTDDKNENNENNSIIDPNQWSVVSAILALGDEEQKLKEQRNMISKRKNFRDELDKQSSDTKAREMQYREDRRKSMELSKSSASSNNEENKDIQQILEARIKKEKALRLAQISERKENKILAQQQQLAIEKKEIEKIKKLTLDDEERKNYKREQQKKMFDAVKEEDDRNRMMKEARLQSQREYEFKLSKDYEAKMQREEENRASAYQDRINAMALLKSNKPLISHREMQIIEEKRMEQIKHERKMEEIRTNEEFSKKLEDDKKKERLKIEERRKEIMRSTEFNLFLIDKKEQQKQQEKMDATKLRQNMQREAEKQREADMVAAERKKFLMHEVKFTLDEQVKRFKSRKVNDGVLSEMEVALNKGIFDKIERNPELKEKLYARIHPGTHSKLQASSVLP